MREIDREGERKKHRTLSILERGGTNAWRYLVTDHLGTPVQALSSNGAVIWHGGFEPFGKDYQVGASSASANGIFLRFPGQWDHSIRHPATTGTELYYNLYRWYETRTGRYARPDPLDLPDLLAYLGWIGAEKYPFEEFANTFWYARASPLTHYDARALCSSCDECPSGLWNYSGTGISVGWLVGGRTYGRGSYACDEKPWIQVRVTITCKLGAGYFGAGWSILEGTLAGPLGPAGCGCNRRELIGSGSSTGQFLSAGIVTVTRSRCGSQRPYAGTGGLGPSIGFGITGINCTVVPRLRSWL